MGGMRAEIDHELSKPENAQFKAASNGFPGIGKQVWDVGMAIKHTHRQLGYALEAIVDRLVRSGEMNELMSGQQLRYSVPGYYRDFLDQASLARARASLVRKARHRRAFFLGGYYYQVMRKPVPPRGGNCWFWCQREESYQRREKFPVR